MVENKRGKGEGSVFRRSKDGKWVGMLTLPSVDGKRKRQSVIGNTEEEATRKLEALRVKHTPHTIYLPQGLGEQAIKKAAKRRETLSDVVRPAVEDYVDDD